jgi:hypothetical protein
MESVHVFRGIYSFQNALGVYLRWQRQLNQDSVNDVIAIQIFDLMEQGGRADGRSGRDKSTGKAELLAGGDFAFDVKVRGGIFAHEHGGKSGPDAHGGEESDFIL